MSCAFLKLEISQSENGLTVTDSKNSAHRAKCSASHGWVLSFNIPHGNQRNWNVRDDCAVEICQFRDSSHNPISTTIWWLVPKIGLAGNPVIIHIIIHMFMKLFPLISTIHCKKI